MSVIGKKVIARLRGFGDALERGEAVKFTRLRKSETDKKEATVKKAKLGIWSK